MRRACAPASFLPFSSLPLSRPVPLPPRLSLTAYPFPVLQIVEHTEENKMTPANLAIVLGPNLVWSQSEVASLSSIGEINSFVLLLIKNYEYIFN